MKLPDSLAPLFHNYDPATLDPDRHAGLIIRTVLGGGSWDQVLWLFRHYGYERVQNVFLTDCRSLRTLPAPTRRLWGLVFLGDADACRDEEDPASRWGPRRRPTVAEPE